MPDWSDDSWDVEGVLDEVVTAEEDPVPFKVARSELVRLLHLTSELSLQLQPAQAHPKLSVPPHCHSDTDTSKRRHSGITSKEN